MLRCLMLDFGNTLVRESNLHPFVHVEQSLETITGFKTQASEPLEWCLVSDFPARVPVPPGQLETTFQSFIRLLQDSGLARHFQPLERRVTLSAHAGVPKPNAAVFKTAITRLEKQFELNECIFITENSNHVSACRLLGMQALQFGGHVRPSASNADFADWVEAPMLIARALGLHLHGNLEASVREYTAAVHPSLNDIRVSPAGPEGVEVRGSTWTPLDAADLGELRGVHVQMPVRFQVSFDDHGRLREVGNPQPTAADLSEATQHVRSLLSSGQVASTGTESPLGPTHVVETDSEGRRLLKRKRFRSV